MVRRTVPAWVYWSPIVLASAALLFSYVQPFVPPEQMLREPVTAGRYTDGTEFLPLLGSLSNLGVLLWCTGASVAFFSGLAARSGAGRDAASTFLILAGLLSGVLTVDDLFQVHEHLFPRLTGLPEPTLFAIYGLLLAGLLVTYRAEILRLGAGLLGLALIAFAASLLIDVLIPATGIGGRFAEDGFKLYGIALWTTFLLRASWATVIERMPAGR